MIAFLRGELAGKTDSAALIDVNGVGYLVNMGALTLAQLPEVGEQVLVLTHFQVSDAGAALYGFLTREEQTLFEELLGVSGVGPKVALAAVGFYTSAELARAIAAEDVTKVSRIPGVGKKTAQRIILELKGSLDSLGAGDGSAGMFADAGEGTAAVAVVPAKESPAEVAFAALLSMGFTSREAELALQGAPAEASESVLLQYALKNLG